MARINSNFLKLPKRCTDTVMKETIRLDLDDVSLPITKSVIQAMHSAVDELSDRQTFRGYAPVQGYEFLIKAIIQYEYAKWGVQIAEDEVFVSTSAKSDIGGILELFDINSKIAICDPVNPTYFDANIIAGRFDGIAYLPCIKENNFSPDLPSASIDLIYLNSPNCITGTALTKAELAKWVSYARATNAVILYDSTYSAYIMGDEHPRSIYEIDGAKDIAIEFKSLSKSAGFSGIGCAFTVVPHQLSLPKLNQLWHIRQAIKVNGTSYVAQRAAEAVYTARGQMESVALVNYYMANAHIICSGLADAGFEVYGGEHAPYIWWKLSDGVKSHDFSQKLRKQCGVSVTPGAFWGSCGEGYCRLSAFGDREKTFDAVKRIRDKRSELL